MQFSPRLHHLALAEEHKHCTILVVDKPMGPNEEKPSGKGTLACEAQLHSTSPLPLTGSLVIGSPILV